MESLTDTIISLHCDPQLELHAENLYNKIISMNGRFNHSVNESIFPVQKRIKILKILIVFYQQREEFEKCAKIMEVLHGFGIMLFNIERI